MYVIISHTGIYNLPVTNLIQSQSNLRLIRQLDTIFVKHLKHRIQEDPSGPGVSPVTVLCVDVTKQDLQINLRIYTTTKYLVVSSRC